MKARSGCVRPGVSTGEFYRLLIGAELAVVGVDYSLEFVWCMFGAKQFSHTEYKDKQPLFRGVRRPCGAKG